MPADFDELSRQEVGKLQGLRSGLLCRSGLEADFDEATAQELRPDLLHEGRSEPLAADLEEGSELLAAPAERSLICASRTAHRAWR